MACKVKSINKLAEINLISNFAKTQANWKFCSSAPHFQIKSILYLISSKKNLELILFFSYKVNSLFVMKVMNLRTVQKRKVISGMIIESCYNHNRHPNKRSHNVDVEERKGTNNRCHVRSKVFNWIAVPVDTKKVSISKVIWQMLTFITLQQPKPET